MADRPFLPYRVTMHLGSHCVYRYRDSTRNMAQKISAHRSYEEARAEAYRLNGEWMREQRGNKM